MVHLDDRHNNTPLNGSILRTSTQADEAGGQYQYRGASQQTTPRSRVNSHSHTDDDVVRLMNEVWYSPVKQHHPQLGMYAGSQLPRAGSGLVRIDELRFLAGSRKSRLTKPGSVCPVS